MKSHAPAEGAGFKLVWSDEFNTDGPVSDADWVYEQGFERNREAQWYQPQNVVCRDGFLIIEARRERADNPGYKAGSTDWRYERTHSEFTSGSIKTLGKHEWTFGRFEMRGRIDIREGCWPAFWALGTARRWPGCGEIDMMEYFRGTLSSTSC